ncbi:hypothetical protein DCAR_0206388 [Daucus carota subsp. sativus]|uniref:Rab-GAP TBC domain-containing protein n=1 Tax=Daucus carota subsp. sativus TaxID=79200 RepID=A0AAF1AP38_DAUCS|nr:hypothetical protein DCAR_0206388 [Daucus carota subsp. sativus]
MIQGCLSLREKYAELKAECKKMVPIFGTGKFITTPIVNNDGEPVEGEAGNLNGSMPDTAGVTDKESEANQARLWEVLAVYSWMDNKIGYVQGMNDICSPMVILLEDDADAFWCYEHAMRRLVCPHITQHIEISDLSIVRTCSI